MEDENPIDPNKLFTRADVRRYLDSLRPGASSRPQFRVSNSTVEELVEELKEKSLLPPLKPPKEAAMLFCDRAGSTRIGCAENPTNIAELRFPSYIMKLIDAMKTIYSFVQFTFETGRLVVVTAVPGLPAFAECVVPYDSCIRWFCAQPRVSFTTELRWFPRVGASSKSADALVEVAHADLGKRFALNIAGSCHSVEASPAVDDASLPILNPSEHEVCIVFSPHFFESIFQTTSKSSTRASVIVSGTGVDITVESTGCQSSNKLVFQPDTDDNKQGYKFARFIAPLFSSFDVPLEAVCKLKKLNRLTTSVSVYFGRQPTTIISYSFKGGCTLSLCIINKPIVPVVHDVD